MRDTPAMLRELNVVEQSYRAVLEVLDGIPVTEVAERFGVARQTVHRWPGFAAAQPAVQVIEPDPGAAVVTSRVEGGRGKGGHVLGQPRADICLIGEHDKAAPQRGPGCRVPVVEGQIKLADLIVPALVSELALPERLLHPDDIPFGEAAR